MMNYNNPNYNSPYYTNPYQNYYQPSQPFQNQLNQYAYVNGIEGAKSYQVQPGKTVLLIDNDNPFIYFKSSNELGQSSLKYFTIAETDESKIKGSNGQPTESYVAKSDFEDLSKKYEKLLDKIKKIEKSITASAKEKDNVDEE